ncbi:hypothetical protein BDQ17DRAFT_1365502 [Cyathus striatus]|nr:hypothetical protein BDQ17DRAFT_1365502 [Cyathus striatus]
MVSVDVDLFPSSHPSHLCCTLYIVLLPLPPPLPLTVPCLLMSFIYLPVIVVVGIISCCIYSVCFLLVLIVVAILFVE